MNINKFSRSTLAFVKAVANPIAADEPAQVPDLEQSDSICMNDYNETSRPVNNTGAPQSGLLVWLRVHESPFYTSNVASGASIYSLCYAFLDANGLMVPNSVTTKFEEYVPANLTTIQGGSGITPNNALVTGLRVFAMGIRALPTVEFVTDTTVTYVVRYIGGQVSMQELGAAYTNSTNVETIIRNSSCAETYANNEGCAVRYNPFQNEYQLRIQNLEDCLNTAQSFTFHKMPAILLRFSATIAAGSSAPVILHARYWIEGVLKKPTPIYAEQSPTDLNYPSIRVALSGCHPEFPIVTKGHSFPAIASMLFRLATVVYRISKGVVQTADIMQGTASSLQKQYGGNKQARRRRRRNKMNQFNPNKGPGRNRPPKNQPNVPNTRAYYKQKKQ
jgi:hypothetical protein